MASRAVTLRPTEEENDFLDWMATKNRSYRNTIAGHLLSAAIQQEMQEHRTEFDAYRAALETERQDGTAETE